MGTNKLIQRLGIKTPANSAIAPTAVKLGSCGIKRVNAASTTAEVIK